MTSEIREKLENLKSKIPFLRDRLEVSKKQEKIKELEKKSSEAGFWDDAKKAGGAMKKLEGLKSEVEEIGRLESEIGELSELWEMEKREGEIEKEIKRDVNKLEKEISALEFKALLDKPYDKNDAILTIHSGAGGVDAQDWAEMLMRMYLRWAEKKNFKAKIIDESRGAEAGIKSATLEIGGSFTYGYLKGEAGTHRLVRLSPFNSDNLRQTSFALVEVLPVIEEIKEVEINPADLRIDTFRSSGAGGQSVNKTDSAVRITHLPTKISAACQSERSQAQNKERAIKVLKAKLHQKYLKEQEKEKKKLKGEHQSAEWGSQIRSYVLHPYKMAKDHRTKCETNEVEKVLDGDIDKFIQACLEKK
ncbi:peptide chain release factor 2 [bacterium]|nr:peptide chain release factor 2 [bacterium]